MSHARTVLRAGVVATSVVAACQFTHGRLPADGGNDGDVADAGMCTSLASECAGDVLRVCTALGEAPTDFPCGWGCVPGAAAHCAHVIPSGSGGVDGNGVRPSDVVGDDLSAITFPDGVVMDSDNGRIGTLASPNMFHTAATGIENGIDFQNRGPISMFRFKSLRITGAVSLIGKRPIALVSDGDITINGVIDAQGGCLLFNPGPGGFGGGSAAGATGGQPTTTMGGGSGAPAPSTGGGGGGHGTDGGSGNTANGGTAYGDAQISVLVGGAGGGAGSGGGNFGRGGGGGGALQLISNSKVVITAGGINASGCGGKAGTGNNDSGGGGGAGGTILIEAPVVEIAGALTVNGGGGGGGGGGNATSGGNGRLDRTAATAGQGDGNNEQGGTGGTGSAAPGAGSNGSAPGGGGGAVGRIRINTRNGTGAIVTNATLSPGPNDPGTTFSTGSAAAQ